MKLLFISSGKYPDYQNDMLFHGLKSLPDVTVYENNDLWYMYNNITPEEKIKLYGKGFSVYGLLDASLKNVEDSHSILEKIETKFYDVIIYGSVTRDSSYLDKVIEIYDKKRIFFVDGEDKSRINEDLLGKGLFFKRELIDKFAQKGVLPINFAIPKIKIVNPLPGKEKDWATIIPGDKSTYIFDTEKDYYLDYQKSKFGKTKKKSGWDCLRHYEILANGCIPYFPDIENCPPYTLLKFPKGIIHQTNRLIRKKKMTQVLYDYYINYLLRWTQDYLSTEAIATDVLNKL
jgi:hypothetical protein